MYIVHFLMQLIIFFNKTLFYTFIFFCPVNKKFLHIKTNCSIHCIEQIVLYKYILYKSESTFYNYLQHNFGLTSEKQHQF